MKATFLKWLGFGGLFAMLLTMGWVLVPAHANSIWMDREFTDWISPIANRLHDGARLYTDGMHTPMPPIPYVLLRVMHPGGTIWIQENFLNYFFQSATILLLYLVFARQLGPGLAFAACMATIPVFLAFAKTILYDSLAQFLVVVCALLFVALFQSLQAAGRDLNTRLKLGLPSMVGLALGLLMLTKQSTGLGAVVGICFSLAVLPAPIPFRRRCENIILILLVTALTIIAASLAMSRFISFPGMLHDVFLASSEPKGGPRKLFANLARYTYSIAKIIAVATVLFYAVSALRRRKIAWRAQAEDLETGLNHSNRMNSLNVSAQGYAMLIAMLTGVACALAIFWLPEAGAAATYFKSAEAGQVKMFLLNMGLAASLALGVTVAIQGFRGTQGRLAGHPLAPYAIIFFATAVFHNLSVHVFRWWSDNNPLIAVALAFVLSPLFDVFKTGADRRTGWAVTGLIFGITCSAVMWFGFFSQFKAARDCTVPWPEIPHLAHARLRPECDALRQLVKIVQAHADKSRHDTVLLLPNDPNVETWIDRDRPALSCNILFTDQYWDRYVDPDFASLCANPPKVIIIGPRNYWRQFSRVWHWYKDVGLLRLIDRVQNELLPAKYDLLVEHPISFEGGTDFMDVYVRRSQ